MIDNTNRLQNTPALAMLIVRRSESMAVIARLCVCVCVCVLVGGRDATMASYGYRGGSGEWEGNQENWAVCHTGACDLLCMCVGPTNHSMSASRSSNES